MISRASGTVLEVGFGSGLNLPYYNENAVTKLFALEPNDQQDLSNNRVKASNLDIEFIGLPSEEIPLETASMDTVLITFTMCTIPDIEKALLEMRRVLKPNGRLLFSEHGKSPDLSVSRWQDGLHEPWGKCFGGCNLNRHIPTLLTSAGFKISDLNQEYGRNTLKFIGYFYRGTASL